MMDDEEITDVRPILLFEEDEATAPGVDEAVIHAEVTMEVTPVDASMNLAPTLRLPRTRVAELDQAIDFARMAGATIETLQKSQFPLGGLEQKLHRISSELEEGCGFVRLRGLPLRTKLCRALRWR